MVLGWEILQVDKRPTLRDRYVQDYTNHFWVWVWVTQNRNRARSTNLVVLAYAWHGFILLSPSLTHAIVSWTSEAALRNKNIFKISRHPTACRTTSLPWRPKMQMHQLSPWFWRISESHWKAWCHSKALSRSMVHGSTQLPKCGTSLIGFPCSCWMQKYTKKLMIWWMGIQDLRLSIFWRAEIISALAMQAISQGSILLDHLAQLSQSQGTKLSSTSIFFTERTTPNCGNKPL